MQLRLDKTKSYGHISGHRKAAYEQFGGLFDGAGNLITEDDEDDELPTSGDTTAEEAFVREMLAGGPVLQANIYKEVNLRGLNWVLTKEAAGTLGVTIGQEKGKPIWSLK